MTQAIALNQSTSLVNVVDRLIDNGVVVQGEAMLSVAEIDLVYLSLQLVLCNADRIPQHKTHTHPTSFSGRPDSDSSLPINLVGSSTTAKNQQYPESTAEVSEISPLESSAINPSDTAKGVAQLVLTLVEFLRELLERQAIHRMERNTLSDTEVQQMSVAFMALAERVEELKNIFDLDDQDLNLDLGPLGKLLD